MNSGALCFKIRLSVNFLRATVCVSDAILEFPCSLLASLPMLAVNSCYHTCNHILASVTLVKQERATFAGSLPCIEQQHSV